MAGQDSGKTVVVLGAGVGGLAAAHELCKRGFRVAVYERNAEPGGIARSATEPDGEHNEVTWHVIGGGYGHLIRLLSEIPAADGRGTVADRLVPLTVYAHGRAGDEAFIEVGNCFVTAGSVRRFVQARHKIRAARITVHDIVKMGALLGFVRTAHPARFEHYESVTWDELLDDLSEEAKKWASKVLCAFTGMVPSSVSAHAYLSLARPSKMAEFSSAARSPEGDPIHFYSFDGPMNRVWFDPWVRHLESRGVRVHLGTPVTEVRCNAGRVEELVVETQRGAEKIRADAYVTTLDPGALARVLRGADDLAARMTELDTRSRVLQLQVAFTFDEKIHYDGQTMWVLPDTPWGILVRAEGSCWKEPMSLGAGRTREILSAAFAIADAPGIVHGKSARSCTREEIIDEIWAQLKQARGALRAFRTADGRTLDQLKYTSARIWHSFQFDSEKAQMSTYEPKFGNNVGTLALRPSAQEPTLRNLVHGGAYARTDANLHNMESATEAGVRAANLIATGCASAGLERYPEPAGVLGVLRRIDRALFTRGYRHPLELLMTPAKLAAKISHPTARPAGWMSRAPGAS